MGEKLFEEKGKLTSANVRSVHPVEGTKMEVSFMSEIQGLGRCPSGKNVGSATIHQYPHGVVDASHQGVFTTAGGDQYMWWAHQKGKVVEGGKIKALIMVTGYSNSPKLSWMNNLIMVLDAEFNPATQEFTSTAYEWK